MPYYLLASHIAISKRQQKKKKSGAGALQPATNNKQQQPTTNKKERRAVRNGTPSNLQPVKPATLQPVKPKTSNLFNMQPLIYSNLIEAGKKIFAFRQRVQYLCGFLRPLARIEEKGYNILEV